RIAQPPDEPALLEAVEHAGDRPGGEAGELRDPAGGDRLLGPQNQLQALVVGAGQPHLLGDPRVEQHHHGRQLTVELAELLQHRCGNLAGRTGHEPIPYCLRDLGQEVSYRPRSWVRLSNRGCPKPTTLDRVTAVDLGLPGVRAVSRMTGD